MVDYRASRTHKATIDSPGELNRVVKGHVCLRPIRPIIQLGPRPRSTRHHFKGGEGQYSGTLFSEMLVQLITGSNADPFRSRHGRQSAALRTVPRTGSKR